MTAYVERELRYERDMEKGYQQILVVARKGGYPFIPGGRQFVDFTVGTADDVVSKVRVLVDFRGEYFSSFVLKSKVLPIDVLSRIRNKVHFTAKEAFDSIMRHVNDLNKSV